MSFDDAGSRDTETEPIPGVSIVIPVRNGADTLAEQLEALVRADKPDGGFEVVVVDNGSSDDTANLARSYADRLPLRVIDAHTRASINFARNAGIASARHRHIVLCDADDQVDKGWLVAMAQAFKSGHQLLAGPIDYELLNPENVRAWRGADRASVMTVLGFLPTGHGANLGFTRAIYDRIGGFDEGFVFGGDDVDFCWRAQLSGADLHDVPHGVVHYRLRPTLRGLFEQSRAYGSAEVRLYSRFGDHGMRRRRIGTVIYELWWLVSRAPFAISLGRRGAWVRRLGQQIGRVEGAWGSRMLWW